MNKRFAQPGHAVRSATQKARSISSSTGRGRCCFCVFRLKTSADSGAKLQRQILDQECFAGTKEDSKGVYSEGHEEDYGTKHGDKVCPFGASISSRSQGCAKKVSAQAQLVVSTRGLIMMSYGRKSRLEFFDQKGTLQSSISNRVT